jgi:hypothetical protein
MEQAKTKARQLWSGASVAGENLRFNLLYARCASSLSTYTFVQIVTVTTMGGVGFDH